MSELLHSTKSVIRQSFSTPAKQKAAYRFLSNDNVSEKELIECCLERTCLMVQDRHLLVINDTTEINLENHRGRIDASSGIGPTGNNKDLGFFMHLGLAIDAVDNQAIGYSSMQIWHRPEDKGTKKSRAYQSLPVEEKESYKWIKCANDSKSVLATAASVTLVGDRESDMYELFTDATKQGLDLVVRSRINRKTTEHNIYDQLKQTKSCGTHQIKIVGDIRKNSKNRIANLTVKFKEVELLKPSNKADERKSTIKVYVVEAKEKGKKNSICWRLLTTHKVENFNVALEIIEWYRKRWFIEEVFRLLKAKGYKIEESEIEDGWALRKLSILLLQNILRVMQMLVAYNSTEEHDAGLTFTPDELECLEKIGKRKEGKTEKLKNNYKPGTLKWATWIIARLGGWSGYKSQRPPGPITLKNGLDKFSATFEGWMLAKDVGTR